MARESLVTEMENQQNYNGLKVMQFLSKMQRNKKLEARDRLVNLAQRKENRKTSKKRLRLLNSILEMNLN